MPSTRVLPRAGSPVAPHDPVLPAVDPSVHIRLCGTLRVERDGLDVTPALPGPKARTLVAFLAARFPEGVGRDELIDVVWPGNRPSDPRANLRTVMSRVREVLGSEIFTSGNAVRLSAYHVDTDLTYARARAQAAREAQRRRHAQDAVEHAQAVLDILDRRALVGFEDAWVDELWVSLDNDALEMLACIADMGSLAGGSLGTTAISAARELTERDGGTERSHAHLILALARAGERGEALQAYEAARTQLRRHLGISPGRELRDLHTSVLVGRLGSEPFEDRGPAVTVTPLPARLWRSGPFIGRERELGLVRDPGPADWGSRVVTVTGAAGAGKTTLVMRAAELATERGEFVLHSTCRVAERTPYEPFAGAVRRLARSLPPRTAERLLAPLRHDIAAPPRRGQDRAPTTGVCTSELAPLSVAESVTTLLRRLATTAPVLFALDDAHLANHEACLLLRHVERAVRDLPVTFLISHREGSPEPVGSRPAAGALGRRLTVGDVMTDIRRERRITPVPLAAFSAGAASQGEGELRRGVA